MIRRLSIVILHYNGYEITIKCINNFRKQNWEDIEYHLIIVDNNSPDKSGKLLAKEMANEKDIDVILLNENIGFSRGNNVGITYARNKYNSELIVVSNNDIIIDNPDFFVGMFNNYDKTSFAVMGPDVFSVAKSTHQSPIRNKLMTTNELRKFISKRRYTLFVLKLIKPLHIYGLLKKIKFKIKHNSNNKQSKSEAFQERVVINGAFFVLSDKYFEVFPEGLYDNVFMYMEEDILAFLCNINNLKIIYTPNLSVKHLDGASTLNVNKSYIKKYIFELENTIKSANELLNLMNKR